MGASAFGSTWAEGRDSEPTATLNRERALATYDPAGFWLRFFASCADGTVVILLTAALGQALGVGTLGWLLAHVCVWLVYSVLFEVTPLAATPGKLSLGIEVADLHESHLGPARAILRNVCKLLSISTIMLGFLLAAVPDEKQALHDRLTGARVIRRTEGSLVRIISVVAFVLIVPIVTATVLERGVSGPLVGPKTPSHESGQPQVTVNGVTHAFEDVIGFYNVGRRQILLGLFLKKLSQDERSAFVKKGSIDVAEPDLFVSLAYHAHAPECKPEQLRSYLVRLNRRKSGLEVPSPLGYIEFRSSMGDPEILRGPGGKPIPGLMEFDCRLDASPPRFSGTIRHGGLDPLAPNTEDYTWHLPLRTDLTRVAP